MRALCLATLGACALACGPELPPKPAVADLGGFELSAVRVRGGNCYSFQNYYSALSCLPDADPKVSRDVAVLRRQTDSLGRETDSLRRQVDSLRRGMAIQRAANRRFELRFSKLEAGTRPSDPSSRDSTR